MANTPSSCCRNRRRRRAMTTNNTHSTPMNTQQAYVNNNPAGYGNQNHNQGFSNTPQYAPPAGAPPQQYGGSNDGYYGQQNGISQPQNTYQQGFK